MNNIATLTFHKERDTKNKVRFAEEVAEGDAPVVGTLYVSQDAISSEELGDTLEVTITSA